MEKYGLDKILSTTNLSQQEQLIKVECFSKKIDGIYQWLPVAHFSFMLVSEMKTFK